MNAGNTNAPVSMSPDFEYMPKTAPSVNSPPGIRNNLALAAEARYLHMSCGGINSPNLGLNTVTGMIGVSWFF